MPTQIKHNSPEICQKSEKTNTITFLLNGKLTIISKTNSNENLLNWLRNNQLIGSKEGCAEGDCGACSVIIVDTNANGEKTYRSINSCLVLLPTLAGKEVFTVESFSQLLHKQNVKKKLHPVQQEMVNQYGSQCGYCTPGFISSLFEAYYRNDIKENWQIADQLSGNLCRCTGYRPIRDAGTISIINRQQKPNDYFSQNLKKNSQLPPNSKNIYYQSKNNYQFFQPTTIKEALSLAEENPTAQFLAGCTEISVEINKKLKEFPTLISLNNIPELKEIKFTPNGTYLGGNASLTNIEEAILKQDENHILRTSFLKMLNVFAARQIKSRATLGGNLATASPIGDSAPVLLSLDAEINLISSTGERTIDLKNFFTGYRQTVLKKDEIIKNIFIPNIKKTNQTNQIISDFYKISRRRELDISIVSASFRIELDKSKKITLVRLAYGGVAEMTRRAYNAEQALIGKEIRTDQDFLQTLKNEFSPIEDVRSSSQYRKSLITELWLKFANGHPNKTQEQALNFNLSKFQNQSEAPPKNLKHENAIGHVSGKAHYTQDVALRKKMLVAYPIISPTPTGKIKTFDYSKAEKIPGVATILTEKDVPGINDLGHMINDEQMFCENHISYHSQLLGAIVAKDLETCKKALKQIKIEIEPLKNEKLIISIKDAIKHNSFHGVTHKIKRGNTEKILQNAENILEGEFEIGGQEHFYLETHTAWAEMTDKNSIYVMSSTQHPTEIQTIVAKIMGLPKNQVVVESTFMGGGFGGKETQGNLWASVCALASYKTDKPVQIQLDRDHDIQITGKRHPFLAKYKVAYKNNGELQSAKIDLYSNGGWSIDLSQPVTDRALFHLDNAYYIPNVDFSGRIAKTNITSQTAFRGFGGPQGMLVIEEILGKIAQKLNLPAEEVRQINFYHGAGESNKTHYGEIIEENRIQLIWDNLLKKSKFAQRKKQIQDWNKKSTRAKRGIAITPVKFGISFTLKHYNQAGALVLIYQDGSVQVNHAGTEMGQGLHTKILGVAMRSLGLPKENFRIMATRTDKVPNTSATAASSGSDLNGFAVKDACQILKARLRPVALEILGKKDAKGEQVLFENGKVIIKSNPDKQINFAELCKKAYEQRINLCANGFYKTPNLDWNWNIEDYTDKTTKPFHYFAFGAAVSEVEIDGYTGELVVRRVDILHDVGSSLNNHVDRGQIEGGFVQGMGWLTSEELKWHADGRLLTHSASTYAIPAIGNIPAEFNVHILPGAKQRKTIFGSKAVGEPPLMLAMSVREAIRETIANFAEKPLVVEFNSPATHEEIYQAVKKAKNS